MGGRRSVSFFHRLEVKPDHLTYLALLISLLTIPAFFHSLWLGGLGVLISGAIDTMDGGLARKADQKTRSGAFLDSVLDRYSDFFAVFGIWLFFLKHLPRQSALMTALLFFFLIGSFMVSYSRARGEGLGLSISIGFFGRAERVVCLGLGSILNDLIDPCLPLPDLAGRSSFFYRPSRLAYPWNPSDCPSTNSLPFKKPLASLDNATEELVAKPSDQQRPHTAQSRSQGVEGT